MQVKLGGLTISPVVMSPMAGVTNTAYRTLCAEFAPNALLTGDMVNAYGIVYGNKKSKKMLSFSPTEKIRSVQVFGTDAKIMGEAAKLISGESLADHIDINLGCPAPKITRKGGGCALPLDTVKLADVIRETVRGAGNVPVTVKCRIGVDSQRITFINTGKIAEAEGAQAVTLHARTGVQYYSGEADWSKIAELKSLINIPVFGNGDIFEAQDAANMLLETGCDGVAIGRGALGAPWLLSDVADIIDAHGVLPQKNRVITLNFVRNTMFRHLELLIDYFENEEHAVKDFRKHINWYLRGFNLGSATRDELIRTTRKSALNSILMRFDGKTVQDVNMPKNARVRKGLAKGKIHLPEHLL
ncbi:MAG: tRNA dihydrouridine synthase DusB [Bifidobacteriaceae bacterium]|jgi:nifR3 family TIM-barrel protein|nr:tRNA dihydrouridine synthase DusB [Bifidobacteriaceae bacterium]